MSSKKLKGPILIFGAGGFIGFNLLLKILEERRDVFGVTHDRKGNWRFKTGKVSLANIKECDMSNEKKLRALLKKIKPRTIFNLAAFGAYSHQKDPKKIYDTNFTATLNSVEIAKEIGFDAYVYAGTSSEYGSNSAAPREDEELLPNSHYAVSKAAVSLLATYYGETEKLPITHLRLYSAYGPWEERKRLIPQLIMNAEHGTFPPLVNPSISRDYVYVGDIVNAFILAALTISKLAGHVYNVATEKKTTMKDLSHIMMRIIQVKSKPIFSTMPNRAWDLVNWYGNAKKFIRATGWEPQYTLEKGIKKTINY